MSLPHGDDSIIRGGLQKTLRHFRILPSNISHGVAPKGKHFQDGASLDRIWIGGGIRGFQVPENDNKKSVWFPGLLTVFVRSIFGRWWRFSGGGVATEASISGCPFAGQQIVTFRLNGFGVAVSITLRLIKSLGHDCCVCAGSGSGTTGHAVRDLFRARPKLCGSFVWRRGAMERECSFAKLYRCSSCSNRRYGEGCVGGASHDCMQKSCKLGQGFVPRRMLTSNSIRCMTDSAYLLQDAGRVFPINNKS